MITRFQRIALQKTSTHFDKGLEFIEKNIKVNSIWIQEIAHLKTRYNSLQKKYNIGVLPEDQFTVEYNRLTKSLIDLIGDISQNNPVFKNHNIFCRLILPDGQKIDYPVFQGDEIILGRSEDVDIKMESSNISRKHCKIFYRHPKFRITDLNSKNGTYINGHRTNNSVITMGDKVQIGDYTILVLDLSKTDE